MRLTMAAEHAVLLNALRAVFGARPFSALDVMATAYASGAGNPILLPALATNGFSTFATSQLGRKLNILVREDRLCAESHKGKHRYRLPPGVAEQEREPCANRMG